MSTTRAAVSPVARSLAAGPDRVAYRAPRRGRKPNTQEATN